MSRPYVGWGTKFFNYDSGRLVDLFVANGHSTPDKKTFTTQLVHRNLRVGFAELRATGCAVRADVRGAVAFATLTQMVMLTLSSQPRWGGAVLARWRHGTLPCGLKPPACARTATASGRMKIVSGDLGRKLSPEGDS